MLAALCALLDLLLFRVIGRMGDNIYAEPERFVRTAGGLAATLASVAILIRLGTHKATRERAQLSVAHGLLFSLLGVVSTASVLASSLLPAPKVGLPAVFLGILSSCFLVVVVVERAIRATPSLALKASLASVSFLATMGLLGLISTHARNLPGGSWIVEFTEKGGSVAFAAFAWPLLFLLLRLPLPRRIAAVIVWFTVTVALSVPLSMVLFADSSLHLDMCYIAFRSGSLCELPPVVSALLLVQPLAVAASLATAPRHYLRMSLGLILVGAAGAQPVSLVQAAWLLLGALCLTSAAIEELSGQPAKSIA